MTYTLHESRVRRIKSSDDNFHIDDGFVLHPRAMIQITPECPIDYRLMVTECLNRGWVTVAANVKDNELVWDTLGK